LNFKKKNKNIDIRNKLFCQCREKPFAATFNFTSIIKFFIAFPVIVVVVIVVDYYYCICLLCVM